MNLFRKINKKIFKATVVVLFLFAAFFLNYSNVFAFTANQQIPQTQQPRSGPPNIEMLKLLADQGAKEASGMTLGSNGEYSSYKDRYGFGGKYIEYYESKDPKTKEYLNTTYGPIVWEHYRKQYDIHYKISELTFNKPTNWEQEVSNLKLQSAQLIISTKEKLGWDTSYEKKDLKKQTGEFIWCFRVTEGINIPGCLAVSSYFVLYLTSWVLFFSALLFDFTINYSLSMKNIFAEYSMISYGWTLIRDIINLSFILIMVYIAISTILRSETYGYKKMLGKLVIAAILINFSMFFTKVIIDASNIVTLVFYKQINEKSDQAIKNSGGAATLGKQDGISLGIMSALGIQQVWGVGQSNRGLGGGQETSTDPATNAGQDVAAAMGGKISLNPWSMILVGLAGSIFVIILSFIFLAAAIMFLVRAIVLIILVMTSPIAFAANVLPQTSKLSKDWWSKMTSNALFAPAYMLMLFISLQMLWGRNGAKGDILSLFSSEDSSGIANIFFFIFICALLIASLTIASKFGAWGGKGSNDMIRGWGKKLGTASKNFAINRATAIPSRAFDKASRSTGLAKLATSDSAVGRFIGGRSLQALDKLAQAKMGGDSSYRSRVEADKKGIEARAKLAETSLKKKPGEDDMAYFRRTGYLDGTLKKKEGETDDAYEKRTKLTVEERNRATDDVKKAVGRAYGLDNEGKLKSSYLFKGSELAAQGKLEANKKSTEDAASKQIKSIREKLFRTKEETDVRGNKRIIKSGTLLNSHKIFKDVNLIRLAENIANTTNEKNIDKKAADMQRLLDVQQRKLKRKKDAAREQVTRSAAAVTAAAPADKDAAHKEWERAVAELSFIQSDINEVEKHKTDLSASLTKIEDLSVSKAQLDKMDSAGDKK